ncbi:MAG: hypothetical protein WAL37_14545 [Xanthobacteraceae bacterium]
MSVIDNDRPVSAYTGLVIDYSKRKEKVRQAVRRHRRRRQHGIYRRPIDITDAQLDALEERGYLDPDRRGDRADESEAIEMFLVDFDHRPDALRARLPH